MDLRSSIDVWRRVIMTPSEEGYAGELEQPYANMTTAVIWLFAAGLIAVLVWILIFLLLDPFSQSLEIATEFWTEVGLSEAEVAEMVTQMEEATSITMVFMLCSFLLGIPLLTICWSGLLWVMAKLFDGTGSYEKQTFLISAIVTPLIILGAIFYIIPLLNFVLIIAFGIYIVYLTLFVMRVVHGLSRGKAMTAVLTPLIALGIIACCGLAGWLMLVSVALGATT